MPSREFHRDRSTHRGPYYTDGFVCWQGIQQCVEMAQDQLRAIAGLFWSWAEPETEEIGNDQRVVGIEQRYKTAKFQIGTIKSMQQQHRWPTAYCHHWIVICSPVGTGEFQPFQAFELFTGQGI